MLAVERRDKPGSQRLPAGIPLAALMPLLDRRVIDPGGAHAWRIDADELMALDLVAPHRCCAQVHAVGAQGLLHRHRRDALRLVAAEHVDDARSSFGLAYPEDRV